MFKKFLNDEYKCLDDTREDEISYPYSLLSMWLDEDSMHRDHISCHRASLQYNVRIV